MLDVQSDACIRGQFHEIHVSFLPGRRDNSMPEMPPEEQYLHLWQVRLQGALKQMEIAKQFQSGSGIERFGQFRFFGVDPDLVIKGKIGR